MKPVVLVYRIETPDGTMLRLNTMDDSVTHIDLNGETYRISLFSGKFEVSNNFIKATEKHITTSDDHSLIRKELLWGTTGRDGKKDMTFMPVKSLTKPHVRSIIENMSGLPDYLKKVMEDELRFREKMS
ncbi:hypothetical protein [Vibrio barjaei]|uniref:hypothetical protein n=1 Tax=Vibrio barjaei TaxID=1676683 RepID=UPI0022843267|nr:hypothetical protein [Vibrio barjaei]MCY9873830.1 hypothetical protein [Vibrio barjaei]